MRTLLCKCGEGVLIDDEDYPLLSKYTWHCNGEAVSHGQTKITHMLMDRPTGKIIDHIDRNYHNNQRNNLRFATQAENCRNRGLAKNNTSGYKGVSWNRAWVAHIQTGLGQKRIGRFKTAIEAAKAYDKEARKRFKEFAYLNFPNEH